jgi:E3 ubiquitin-protein ligase RNF13
MVSGNLFGMGAAWITPERAYELLQKGWTYLDVRTVAEFTTEHVPGAKNIWFGKWDGEDLIRNPRFLEIVKANFPVDCNLIVSCQTGKERSIEAAERLNDAGFPSVLKIRGGFEEWRRRRLPIASASPTENQYEFLAARAAAQPTARSD